MDPKNQNEYSNVADLMKEQGVSRNLADLWNKECELNQFKQGG